MTILDSNAPLAHFADRPLTVLVFFRGHWCPFCQAYLRELDGSFREHVEAAGGALFGVTAQSAEMASSVPEDWGLHYEVAADPENTLARRFDVAITPKTETPLAEHPTEYASGMAQPAVVAIDASGKVLYRWAIEPSEMNLGGATDRPLPDDVWAAIEAARAGVSAPTPGETKLDPAFLEAHYPKLHDTFQAWVASQS